MRQNRLRLLRAQSLFFVGALVASVLTISAICRGADYQIHVKPLLKHKCYACHGALKQQSGLRLDTAASLIKGGDSGAAVIPGKPDESLLIDVLTGDAGFRMPPANEGSLLTPDEIDRIRAWIAAGAQAPADEKPEEDPQQWWSYRPMNRPQLPDSANTQWCRNQIDRFIDAARTKRGLPHAAEAPRAVWLRRVFLDLTGLPPTHAEQQRFLNSTSQNACENVVDELLSRPQYGERWARHWMDIWRYSDWYGSRGINEIRYSQRHIWRWRDWIVSSLNDDKGYDQMIMEMLAADEIAGHDPAILPATGYLGRNWYKFDRNVWMFETVERTGEAFLGLTFRCCRCHDHKFDPISQEEYYRFRAFFEPHDVRTDPVSALTGTQKDATLGNVLSDGIALVYDKTPDVPTYRFQRGDSRYPDETKPLSPGVPAALEGSVNVQPVQLPVEAWYPMLRPELQRTLMEKSQQNVVAAEDALRMATSAAEESVQMLAAFDSARQNTNEPVDLLADDFQMPRPAVWETVNGTWKYQDGRLQQTAVTSFATMVSREKIVGDFHVHLRYRPLLPGTYRSVGFSFDYLDKGNSQDVYTSTGDTRQSVQAFHRIDGKQVYPKAGIVNTSLTVGEETVLDATVSGSSLTIDLNGTQKLVYTMPEKRRDGRFALWVHQGAAEFLELKISSQVESRDTLERRKQDADLSVRVAQAELNVARAELTSVQRRLAAELNKFSRSNSTDASSLAMEAGAAERALAVRKAQLDVIKAHGNPEKLAEAQKQLSAVELAATTATSEFTPLGEQFPQTSTGRRKALADWIASDRNPRTARVAVNHIWGRHFNRPLVATPENFGLNGRQPTHPLLLDWLATELIANNWKMKPLHRQIVLSSTYRMASQTASLGEPGESSKAPASEVPDEPYKSAVELDPENLFLWHMNSRRMEAEVVRDAALYLAGRLDLTMGGPEIPETDGEKTTRRSMYFRNTPNEKMLMLEVFDMADPNACYRRRESVVPHQSLAMMNSGLIQDAARLVARQLSEEHSADDDGFLAAAFMTVLARSPSEQERARCRTFLSGPAAAQTKSSAEFAAGGTAVTVPSQDPALRAKENLVHVLFLHNDFITVR